MFLYRSKLPFPVPGTRVGMQEILATELILLMMVNNGGNKLFLIRNSQANIKRQNFTGASFILVDLFILILFSF